ncbi:hypothetical protein [Alicycliphilus denitrificans]
MDSSMPGKRHELEANPATKCRSLAEVNGITADAVLLCGQGSQQLPFFA